MQQFFGSDCLCTSTDFLGKQYGLIICWVRWCAKMRFAIPTSDTGLACFYALFLSRSLVGPSRVAVPNTWLVKDALAPKLVEQLKSIANWNTKTEVEEESVARCSHSMLLPPCRGLHSCQCRGQSVQRCSVLFSFTLQSVVRPCSEGSLGVLRGGSLWAEKGVFFLLGRLCTVL